LYNILIELGVSMKLVRLIKIWLSETYSKVRIGKHLSDFSYSKWSKTRRCLITTAVRFWFRICHQEGPEKPGGTKTE
jgi:hypothetical protein